MSEKKHTVNGSWLGNYYYAHTSQPFGFEAVFVESAEGVIEGSILDDGSLGEARVSGMFNDPNITFTKRYNNPLHLPIRYEGTMSEEGKKLTGSWMIQAENKGSWVAWRQEEEEIPDMETEDEKDSGKEVEEEREKVMVRPMTQTRRGDAMRRPLLDQL